MKGKILIAILLSAAFAVGLSSAPTKESSFLLKGELRDDIIKMLPVTTDFRNYFVFQSIEDGSSVLIGDFSGAEKVISLATDKNYDNKQDKVIEFFPDSQKIKDTVSKPSSQFFASFEDMRDSIISGKVFNENYSYKMFSINTLKARLNQKRDIYDWRYGYNIKVYDPDAGSSIMGEFYFSRKDGLYTLIFATYYYKLYKTKIVPPLYYSVYCHNSKDPKVKEVVDELYKLMPAR
jgi:hypothetical protein